MLSGELLPFEGSSQLKLSYNLVRIERGVRIKFMVSGPVKSLVWPEGKTKKRTEGLWNSTCFEVFAAQIGFSKYLEVNLSPAQEWDFYQFDSYRSGMKRVGAEGVLENIVITISESQKTVQFEIHHPCLLTPNLEISPTVVLQDNMGDKTYWAIQHKSDKPDFHWRDKHWRKL